EPMLAPPQQPDHHEVPIAAPTENVVVTPPAATSTESSGNAVADHLNDRFRFGSYGRVQPALDLEGGPGTQTRIGFPSSRVDEASYFELEFGYLAYRDDNDVEVDANITLAFGDSLFHFNGNF